MTTLTGSHLQTNPNYVLTALDKYGATYEHKFETIARKKASVFNQIEEILQDLDGYTDQLIGYAWEGLCSPGCMDLYLRHLGFGEELYASKFYTLESMYNHIDSWCNHMAEEYVPVNSIHKWWKRARAKARSLSNKLAVHNMEDLSLDDQIEVWQSLAPKFFCA